MKFNKIPTMRQNNNKMIKFKQKSYKKFQMTRIEMKMKGHNKIT